MLIFLTEQVHEYYCVEYLPLDKEVWRSLLFKFNKMQKKSIKTRFFVKKIVKKKVD